MHKFTDVHISHTEVESDYYSNGTGRKGVFFLVEEGLNVVGIFLSKEDLLHLLKLIEETN